MEGCDGGVGVPDRLGFPFWLLSCQRPRQAKYQATRFQRRLTSDCRIRASADFGFGVVVGRRNATSPRPKKRGLGSFSRCTAPATVLAFFQPPLPFVDFKSLGRPPLCPAPGSPDAFPSIGSGPRGAPACSRTSVSFHQFCDSCHQRGGPEMMGLACMRSARGWGTCFPRGARDAATFSWAWDLGSAPGFRIFNRRLPSRDSLRSGIHSNRAERLGGCT
jgi:hypothetical protein